MAGSLRTLITATAFLSSLLLTACASQPFGTSQTKPRNIILMISDGFGPAAVTAAREYWGTLTLDEIQAGTVRTRSHSSSVTDSAAGATAFATGVRTYNRGVSVSPDKQPLTTLLHEARARGMATGLVATSAIAHATPAAFSASAEHRLLMFHIAAQQAEADIDLLLGGGREDWLPKDEGGCRVDGKNLLQKMKGKGYQMATFQQGHIHVDTLPAIGLFARNNIPYAIDRNKNRNPSLQQMASKALALLAQQSNGFFLMIEGSRIDHAAHVNDPVAMMHEIKAYDDTVRSVLEFAQRDNNTLVISVSDHETGGFSQGRRVGDKSHYGWQPEVLRAVKASTGHIAKRIIAGDEPVQTIKKFTHLDITDRHEQQQLIQLSEKARLENKKVKSCSGKWLKKDLAKHLRVNKDKKITDKKRLMYWIGERISREAHIGWTTYGHTGVDVNLYAYGPGQERFRGNHNNTAIAGIVADLMEFTRIQNQIATWEKN